MPRDRTSRSETRTCFSISPLKVFFIAAYSGPQEYSFRHDNITSIGEFHNILVDRGVQCITFGPYTEEPCSIHRTDRRTRPDMEDFLFRRELPRCQSNVLRENPARNSPTSAKEFQH